MILPRSEEELDACDRQVIPKGVGGVKASMVPTIRSTTLLLSVALATMPSLGGAHQDVQSSPMYFDAGSMVLRQQVFKTVLDNALRKQGKAGPARRPASTPAGAKAADLTYARSSAVTARVKRDYFARMAKAYGAAGSAALQKAFETQDFVAMWARNEASDGLRPGSLTDSVVAYWTMNWMIANGVPSTSRAQVQALKGNLAPVLAANPTLRRMGDAERQAFSENLMLNYVVQSLGAAAAYGKRDPALLAKLRTATTNRFRQEFGVDLTSIKLTPQGIARA